MPAWLSWVLRLIRRREVVEEIVPVAVELGEKVVEAIDAEPAQPLTWRDVDHIRSQEQSATSHGVVEGPPRPPPPVKARERETVRPPRKPPRPRK